VLCAQPPPDELLCAHTFAALAALLAMPGAGTAEQPLQDAAAQLAVDVMPVHALCAASQAAGCELLAVAARCAAPEASPRLEVVACAAFAHAEVGEVQVAALGAMAAIAGAGGARAQQAARGFGARSLAHAALQRFPGEATVSRAAADALAAVGEPRADDPPQWGAADAADAATRAQAQVLAAERRARDSRSVDACLVAAALYEQTGRMAE